MKKNTLAALAAFALLALAGCGGKESSYDEAINCLVIGVVIAGSFATLAIRFLRQRNNGAGTKKRGGGAVSLFAFVFLVLVGCGGGNSLATPQVFAGEFAGGNIQLKADRGGGGPSVEIGSTTIQELDGRFGATIELIIPGQNPIMGGMAGGVSKDGLITATIDLFDGGKLSIGGGPLHWETNQTNRGGPNRVLSGLVPVIYRPAGGAPQVQYLGSTFKLWR